MWLLLTLILISGIGGLCKLLPHIIPPIPQRDFALFDGTDKYAFINTSASLKMITLGNVTPDNPSLNLSAHSMRGHPWGWLPVDDSTGKISTGVSDYAIARQNDITVVELCRRKLLYNQWVYTGDFRDDWHFPVVACPPSFISGHYEHLRDSAFLSGPGMVKNVPTVCAREKEKVKESPVFGVEYLKVKWKHFTIDEVKEEAVEDRKLVLEERLPFLWEHFPFYDKYWEIIQEYIWHIEPWRPSDDEIIRVLSNVAIEKDRLQEGLNQSRSIKYATIKPIRKFGFYHTYFVPPIDIFGKIRIISFCKNPEIKAKLERYQETRAASVKRIEKEVSRRVEVARQKRRENHEAKPLEPTPDPDIPQYRV